MSQTCSSEQINALLDFLCEHKDLARGLLRTADGRARAKRLWEDVTQLLNSLGGGIKSVQQWQKVWTDRKHTAKKNAAILRKTQSGTGGGPPSASITQWELRVLDIMGEGFGGPQTTARVPAFPTMNIDEEVAQYRLEHEVQTQPVLPFSIESLGLVGTSGNGVTVSAVDLSTEDAHIIELPPTLPEPLSSVQSQLELENSQSTPVAHRNRPSRRLSSRRRPVQGSNTTDRLFQMENEKMMVLQNINVRLSGIEKAILELVKLKQRELNNANS